MQATTSEPTPGTSAVDFPLTLHVAPRVDQATIYQNKSLQRRCAPLSFITPVNEVRVMVPMPKRHCGQWGFDQDSVQVGFGAAFDRKVILTGVLIDEVKQACLRSDGTVQIEATHISDVASASDSDAHSEERGDTASAEVRREMECQLQEVQYRLLRNDIALAEAAAVRDYTVNLAASAVYPSKASPLMSTAALHDPQMWGAHLDALESAKREHSKTKRDLVRAKKALEAEKMALEAKLGLVHDGRQSPCSGLGTETGTLVDVVVLTLRVLQPVPAGPDAVVYVSYMVPSGRWNAAYEAHLNTETNEVVLYYNAEVVLDCGEDLKDVVLTLSSAVPRRNAALPPTMSIWRCGVVEPSPPMEELGVGAGDVAAYSAHSPVCLSTAQEHALPSAAPMMMRAAAQVEQVGTGAIMNFLISNSQTVMANGKTTRLPLTVLSLPASIRYMSVPEKSPAAFTQAKVNNTSDFLLLVGDVAVFLNGNYVLQSRVDRQCAPGGTMNMYFGADPNVEIKRVLLRQTNKTVQNSYFKGAKRRVKTFAYKTIICNKKRTTTAADGTVRIKLIEHIPISDEEQLQVRLVLPPKPQEDVYIYDEEEDKERQRLRKSQLLDNEGIVEIERVVLAGETTEVLFTFEVEAPIDVDIYGL
ncbi:hypothetical protein JKF63_00464 [Porcisia hertigi]|uniref:DUF4139 domain-containing protein n=1 Tax=Porcisia hertigi TaxID=2761500 RepID=A0A836HF59_9TRYP|nr:hypothetical protein JKF63_00464 [Porcisia hertigi]